LKGRRRNQLRDFFLPISFLSDSNLKDEDSLAVLGLGNLHHSSGDNGSSKRGTEKVDTCSRGKSRRTRRERKKRKGEADQLELVRFLHLLVKKQKLTLVDGVNLNGGVDELGDELLSKIL